MANVVITGANRGIGLALVKKYIERGDKVFGLCRSCSDELNQSGAKVITKVDVGNPETLPSALGKLTDIDIDLLINNAGAYSSESLEDWQPNTIEHVYRVNAMGPLLVTQCLLGGLVRSGGGKIVMITSRMGSIEDNTSGGRYGYRMSKAALNAASMSLAHDLKESGVAVAILHPGFVQTEMVNFHGDVSAEQSAANLVQRIDELNLDNTGTFWHANGEVLPW